MPTKTDIKPVIAPATTESYTSAYNRLSAIADKLRAGGASTAIEELVDDLRAARAAHAVCKARLEAVRREVDRELEEAGDVAAR